MSEKYCDDCGSNGTHALDCKYQTVEGFKELAHTYQEAQQALQYQIFKEREQAVFWQGKYSIVKMENNKLRNKMYNNK